MGTEPEAAVPATPAPSATPATSAQDSAQPVQDAAHTHMRLRLLLLGLLPLVCVVLALFIGRYSISPAEVFQALLQRVVALWGQLTGGAADLPATSAVSVPASTSAATAAAPEALSRTKEVLVCDVRLPRALAAACVGAALSASGAAYQGVFHNPLVNPGLLGVSSGASFGAALAIVMLGGGLAIYPCAFAFGVVAVLASYGIARVYRQAPTIMLILGGTIVSSVFSALVSLMKYTADPDGQLPGIVYWLMGSLSSVSFTDFWALAVMLLGGLLLVLLSWRIDVLSLGDKNARALGLEVGRNKAAVISAATLATAGAVCLAGVVGWIGLIVPHIGRMLVGSENRVLVPASAALGASFLLVVDTCARTLWASEIPLGILTALVGAPFFVYLLKKTRAGGWR